MARTNREFLQLAHVFDADKHTVGGWLWSEKLDGQRAFWDGGLTRGMPCRDIPFANVEKHDRFIHQKISTGLWSRYGQPIAAPDSWLNKLPKIFLDGELYAGRGNFQFVESTVREHIPGPNWNKIQYYIFGAPDILSWARDGRINNTNFRKDIVGLFMWMMSLSARDNVMPGVNASFMSVYQYLLQQQYENDVVVIHKQERLPLAQSLAVAKINIELERVTDLGGEGLIIVKPEMGWMPFRVYEMLKIKKFKDSEATVIGYKTGRATDKGSKLLGMMGALIVQWGKVKFELSGFTDAERELVGKPNYDSPIPEERVFFNTKEWAIMNAEKEVPFWGSAKHFPRGSQVTFRYRELTDDGIPKEARYWRKHG